MNSSCLQRLSILLALLALTLPAFQKQWQGTGAMNQTVMAEIHSNIQSHPISTTDSASQVDEIAQNISTSLNKLWDPAWNVMIVKSLSTWDTIVYGYAFNSHWMWISGNPIPMSMGETLDYIIWKDYNCQHWSSVSDLNTAGSSFSNNQVTALRNYMFSRLDTDVWRDAHEFVEYMTADQMFRGGAYTVVMSQYANARFSGYVCLVNNNFVAKKAAMNLEMYGLGTYGTFFFFQTR